MRGFWRGLAPPPCRSTRKQVRSVPFIRVTSAGPDCPSRASGSGGAQLGRQPHSYVTTDHEAGSETSRRERRAA